MADGGLSGEELEEGRGGVEYPFVLEFLRGDAVVSPNSQKYRILVFGIEAKGLRPPSRGLETDKYALTFSSRTDAPRFQSFDGVIFFSRTFESFEQRQAGWGTYLHHAYDSDELDRRTNEVHALIKNDGLACVLLADPFIDSDDRGQRDFRGTDLAKRVLNFLGLERENFRKRVPILRSRVDQLARFFQLYGAACSAVKPAYGNKRSRVLASVGNDSSASVVVDGHVFVIPTLLPKETDEALEEFFTTLMDGVVTLWERLKVELPDWAAEYQFPGEAADAGRRRELADEAQKLDTQLGEIQGLKRVLVAPGEVLVDAVAELFEKKLPLKPRKEESFREDLMLIGSQGEIVALVEVKGVGAGVAREHVNQADSHRERAGRPPEFPSLLIVNTNMKKASSLADKDVPVAGEQVQHAARNNVLILRTLDLLNLASLHANGKLTSTQVIDLLTRSSGWLKVGDAAELLKG